MKETILEVAKTKNKLLHTIIYLFWIYRIKMCKRWDEMYEVHKK
jgi:hypothetical protein